MIMTIRRTRRKVSRWRWWWRRRRRRSGAANGLDAECELIDGRNHDERDDRVAAGQQPHSPQASIAIKTSRSK